MMSDLLIVDIDNTLYNREAEHEKIIKQDKHNNRQLSKEELYEKFINNHRNYTPYADSASTLSKLKKQYNLHPYYITKRSTEHYTSTKAWLENNNYPNPSWLECIGADGDKLSTALLAEFATQHPIWGIIDDEMENHQLFEKYERFMITKNTEQPSTASSIIEGVIVTTSWARLYNLILQQRYQRIEL